MYIYIYIYMYVYIYIYIYIVEFVSSNVSVCDKKNILRTLLNDLPLYSGKIS